MKILLVEDDPKVTDSIQNMSSLQGIDCEVIDNGLDAYYQTRREDYDVIVIDIMLPEINGIDLLKQIRESGNNTPILMLTALSSVDNKVKSLDLGADDYMVKPVSAKEFFARIRALIRRNDTNTRDNRIIFSDIEYFPYKQQLFIKGKKLPITKRESMVLEILLRNSEQTVETETFIQAIWGRSVPKNNLEILIRNVRRLLEIGHSDTRIRNIRSVGYMLENKPF